MDSAKLWTAESRASRFRSALGLLGYRPLQTALDEEADCLLDAQHENGAESTCEAEEEPKILLTAQSSTFQFLIRLRSTLLAILIFLIPSFLQPQTDKLSDGPRKLRSTAYLDGLRGFAALTVVVQHMVSRHMGHISMAYGQGEHPQYLIIQLPFVRLIHCGGAMVKVFFALSGYVLSHKPVRQMRAGQREPLMATMVSSVFRRAIRLYLPVLICTFTVMVLAGLHIYNARFGNTSAMVFQGPRIKNSWYEQIADWVRWMSEVLSPFNWKDGPWHTDYGQHLWAVPVELRTSMILFLMHMAVANMRVAARMTIVTLFMIYSTMCKRYEIFLYLGGFLIAEFNCIVEPFDRAATEKTRPGPIVRRVLKVFTLAVFIFGLYLAGMPEGGPQRAPGYQTISQYTLYSFEKRIAEFWHAVAAFLIVGSLSMLECAQWIFTTRPIQYLGRICFALYLTHNFVMVLVGFPLWAAAWKAIGEDTRLHWNLAFWLANCAIFPIVFWVADIFWRVGDEGSVKVARWLERKLSLPPPAS